LQWDSQKKIHRVTTARQKTGTHVTVPIPPEVANELLAVLNGHPQFFFWSTGNGKEQSAVTNWQHELRTLFRAAGFLTGHPHQLRDTAAVEWLKAGIPLEEVSKLLGHESVKTTERSYSPWIKGRQDRLDALVIASWKSQNAATKS
jgi:integrase/recombinase XerD